MQIVNFQSVKNCNWGYKTSVTQTPLLGYFVSHAKRSSISPFFLRREPSYPLWWNVAHPAFLQHAAAATPDPTLCQREWPHQHVSPCRADCGSALHDHYGTAPYQQDRHPSIQRRFSGNARVGEIPRPKHFAPVLKAPCSQKHSTAGASSRQPARLSVRLAPSAQLPCLRCGLHGPHHLRSGRRRSRGIQPQEARPQVLSSLALLRGRFPGVLAWELAPRQRRCLNRCRPLPQSLFGESPFDDRPLAHVLSRGLGFLRQPCHSL